ncbi:hypothetical protein Golax_023220 [Gossypium laxum]|uniref:Uncharacterized protein n=1 Tax=Gossypium laxum TaxID=34288 RepID=A0A7J9AXT7_9ROSI|nr:hypothetical protein [Gossypium laxum]
MGLSLTHQIRNFILIMKTIKSIYFLMEQWLKLPEMLPQVGWFVIGAIRKSGFRQITLRWLGPCPWRS